MRKNYFAKLARYMKNVYHLERGLNKLSDGRVNPTYSRSSHSTGTFWFSSKDKKL